MKSAPRDDWGNVKIPRLEMLPSYAQQRPEWITVPPVAQAERFSSLIGIPIVGLPPPTRNLTVEFSLETSYMSLGCLPWETFRPGDKRLAGYKRLWGSKNPFSALIEGKVHDTSFFLDGDMTFIGKNVSYDAHTPQRAARLFFVSAYKAAGTANETLLSATRCAVTETHVDVFVHCPPGRVCRAMRVRRSLVDRRPAARTPLNSNFVQTMRLTLPFAYIGMQSSPTENFLFGSVRQRRRGASVNLSQVPPRVFSARLQLVLQTWYQLLLASDGNVFYNDNDLDSGQNNSAGGNLSAVYGYDFAQLPANGAVEQSVVNAACKRMCTRSTQAAVTDTVQVFSYSRVWLALLFTSSGVMLATGLVGAFLGRKVCVPDILGYVASMTYNNRYLPLPESGGVLDAMERARILRDLLIAVGDVKGSSDVGHVALTTSNDVRRLEKGRRYT
jgi:hypothetical protein